MALRVYSTLSGAKEPFQTVHPGRVGIYVCGPTVYSDSHIGHMVGPVIFDTVKRYLESLGYDVTLVINITDVDDKLIDRARAESTTIADLARRVTADYLDCLARLGVDSIDRMPRVSEHIDAIIGVIQGLIDQGHAYAAGGDVYFDVTTDPDYGKLSRRDPEELQAGARIEPSALKKHPGDFALWKAAKPGEPAWDSPWGPGRPGWHIECSVMSTKLLGDHFDIHGGGLDLVFPHHENEIAQSESFTGQPFASYWMHNGLLLVDGQKMSKSVGNVIIARAAIEEYGPDVIRLAILSTHYRSPIEFGHDRIERVRRSLEGFGRFFERFERITGQSFYTLEAPTRRAAFDASGEGPAGEFLRDVASHRERFLDFMDDDFNTGGAAGILYDLLSVSNRFADAAGLETASARPADRQAFARGVVVLRELTRIFNVFRAPPEPPRAGHDALAGQLLDLLVELRGTLRKEKNFKLADTIRGRLSEVGVTLEDRPGGTVWRLG